ncbi:MAG: hypothetical protein ACOYJA_05285 [Christensenellales bacterium]
MQFDFDTPIVRKNTWCTKWDMPTDFGRDDVIPMWIADMDFASPEPVREALMARAAQGAYGYIHPPKACAQAQVDWQRARNGWAVEPDWILDSPGVVGSIRIAINALTPPGTGSSSTPRCTAPSSAACARPAAPWWRCPCGRPTDSMRWTSPASRPPWPPGPRP